MKVSGTASLSAPPHEVFTALNDPAVLVRTIPGVEQLEQVEQDRYRMTVTAGVASIKGSYDGEVSLTDLAAPHGFTLKASGAGAPGTVDATVRVSLAGDGAGTLLSYDADAVVGGMVGGVGQRMLTGVAKKMAGQFFGNVDAVLTGTAPGPEPVAGEAVAAGSPAAAGAAAERVVAAPGAGAVFRAPGAPAGVPSGDELRVPFWIVLAGVGAGAFWALAGVLVGWRIARRG